MFESASEKSSTALVCPESGCLVRYDLAKLAVATREMPKREGGQSFYSPVLQEWVSDCGRKYTVKLFRELHADHHMTRWWRSHGATVMIREATKRSFTARFRKEYFFLFARRLAQLRRKPQHSMNEDQCSAEWLDAPQFTFPRICWAGHQLTTPTNWLPLFFIYKYFIRSLAFEISYVTTITITITITITRGQCVV